MLSNPDLFFQLSQLAGPRSWIRKGAVSARLSEISQAVLSSHGVANLCGEAR